VGRRRGGRWRVRRIDLARIEPTHQALPVAAS
jgi:hypothetical protein